eukprot:18606-Heterococcus_DN1.PRE.1
MSLLVCAVCMISHGLQLYCFFWITLCFEQAHSTAHSGNVLQCKCTVLKAKPIATFIARRSNSTGNASLTLPVAVNSIDASSSDQSYTRTAVHAYSAQRAIHRAVMKFHYDILLMTFHARASSMA